MGLVIDLSNSGGGIPSGSAIFNYTATNYTDLTTVVAPTANEGELAIVYNSQGVWLINRKLKGVYIYQGGVWEYANQELQDRIKTNQVDISTLQTDINNHISNLSNPHSTTFDNLNDTILTNKREGSHYVWDSLTNQYKPSNIITKAFRFDGSVDFVFYSDDDVEFRWNAQQQPQFRVKNAWDWFDAGIWLVRGNSQQWRRRSDDIATYNNPAFSGWFYFTQGGTSDNAFNFGNWGAKALCHLIKEDNASSSNIASYSLEILKGADSSVVVELKIIHTS